MGHAKNKAITFMNDALRDYVYGPRRWFNPLRVVFIVVVAVVAAIVGDAFAHYMVPATADNGTFTDGYTSRYMFDVGAVAFIVVAALARRAFSALCAAYVRRLDMDDAISAGGVKPCTGDVKPNASDADAKSAPSRSYGGSDSANGDYAGDVGGREDDVSEGGDE